MEKIKMNGIGKKLLTTLAAVLVLGISATPVLANAETQTKTSALTSESAFEIKSYDVGYRYNGERYYVYRYKKDDKFYLIRHLYSSFGSDDILISNELLSNLLISSFFAL